MELVTLKFGRAQETEADVTGIRLLSDARIAPDGMIRFLNGSRRKTRLASKYFQPIP